VNKITARTTSIEYAMDFFLFFIRERNIAHVNENTLFRSDGGNMLRRDRVKSSAGTR
jgi:hypothetical protein